MKSFNNKLAIASAVSLVMGLSIAGNAQANSYAYSKDALLDGFFISNNLLNVFGTPVNTSAAGASLTGSVGIQDAKVGVGLQNVPEQNLGGAVGTADDTFGQIYPGVNSNFSRGDAAITQEQFGVGAGQGIFAANVAEANVQNATAESRGNNSSGTLFTIPLDIVTPDTVTFDMTFDPEMTAFLDAFALPGSKAESILAVSFTITDANTSATVFSFAPNGVVDAGEAFDDANLNLTLARFSPGTSSLYAGVDAFRAVATTGVLPAGQYNVVASMAENVSVIHTAQSVPEIDATAATGALTLLFGALGLLSNRRRPQADLMA